MDWKTALESGFFEVLAIVPGTSRSGATIIGGMLCGCSRTAAAEFTFFLAIPVMFGWGMVKAIKFFLASIAMTQVEIVVLVVGIVFCMNDFTVFGSNVFQRVSITRRRSSFRRGKKQLREQIALLQCNYIGGARFLCGRLIGQFGIMVSHRVIIGY